MDPLSDRGQLAWSATQHGEPEDVLELVEAAMPVAGPDQLVVEVEACGLNFADGLLCRGTYQRDPGLPFTPGLEVVGRVVGDTDLVMAPTVLPHGGLARYCVVRSDQVSHVPDGLDVGLAASVAITYPTAWVALARRARVRPGETVVVFAGAGGTGAACIAVARALGARVIATAGGPEKTEMCLELGADVALDHRRDDIAAHLQAATEAEGAHVIVDPVGGKMFDAATHAVAFEGRIVVLGFASGEVPTLRANHVMVKNYEVIGVQWPAYPDKRPEVAIEAQHQILSWLASGAVDAPRRTDVPLEQARTALVDLLAGRTTGKLVVRPTGDR